MDRPAASDEIELAHEASFRLGAFEVSPATRELTWPSGEEILQPRVMQVLVCLAQGGGAVISRDDLVRRCWDGRIVGEDAINRCIGKVRQIAEIDSNQSFQVETIPRVGYRLRIVALPPKAGAAPAPEERTEQTLASRRAFGRRTLLAVVAALGFVAVSFAIVWRLGPLSGPRPPSMRSLAILPIRNLTGEPAMDAAAARLTDDVTYILDRGRFMVLAPPGASAQLLKSGLNEQAIGRRLGVRQVVEIALGKSDLGYRADLKVVDAQDGREVDSEQLDAGAPAGAFPESQMALELFERVSQEVRGRWTADELAKAPDDGDPDNLWIRIDQLEQASRRADISKMEHLIGVAQHVITPDTHLQTLFLANTCFYYVSLLQSGFDRSIDERSRWERTALAMSEQAAASAPNSAYPYACRSELLTVMGRWADAEAAARHVIESLPLTASGWEALGHVDMARGDFGAAIKDFTVLAQREGGRPVELGEAELFDGDLAAGATELREQAILAPNDPQPALFLTAALQLSGDQDGARREAAVYRRLDDCGCAWRRLDLSDEAAFLKGAAPIRAALHEVGLDEPKAQPAQAAGPEPETPG